MGGKYGNKLYATFFIRVSHGGPAKLAQSCDEGALLAARLLAQRALGVAAGDELLHAELPERRDLLGDEGPREAGGRAVPHSCA